MSRQLYKLLLAIITGLTVCMVTWFLLVTILNEVFLGLINPDFEFMDPESNAVFFASSVGYLITDNMVWFAAIFLAGISSSYIYNRKKYTSAMIIGCIIFIVYYLNLPTDVIIALYPSWYIYSPFGMALSVVFVGAATYKLNKSVGKNV